MRVRGTPGALRGVEARAAHLATPLQMLVLPHPPASQPPCSSLVLNAFRSACLGPTRCNFRGAKQACVRPPCGLSTQSTKTPTDGPPPRPPGNAATDTCAIPSAKVYRESATLKFTVTLLFMQSGVRAWGPLGVVIRSTSRQVYASWLMRFSRICLMSVQFEAVRAVGTMTPVPGRGGWKVCCWDKGVGEQGCNAGVQHTGVDVGVPALVPSGPPAGRCMQAGRADALQTNLLDVCPVRSSQSCRCYDAGAWQGWLEDSFWGLGNRYNADRHLNAFRKGVSLSNSSNLRQHS